MLKEDLIGFLSDTDAWAITELKKACETADWGKISSVIDVMDSLHNCTYISQTEQKMVIVLGLLYLTFWLILYNFNRP